MSTYQNGKQYVASILSVGAEQKEGKNPQLVYEIEIKCERDGGECPVERRFMWMPLTENTWKRRFNDLKQLGYTGDSFAQLNPDHPEYCSLAEQECYVFCKYDEWNGKVTEKFDFVNASPSKNDPAVLTKLDDLLKVWKAKDAKNSPATAAPKPARKQESMPF